MRYDEDHCDLLDEDRDLQCDDCYRFEICKTYFDKKKKEEEQKKL